jgi:hypothetical protein
MKKKEHQQIGENVSEVVLPKQLQLAEIVEMIHTASIIHDDVIDDAQTRRGVNSVNIQYGSHSLSFTHSLKLTFAFICSHFHPLTIIEWFSLYSFYSYYVESNLFLFTY